MVRKVVVTVIDDIDGGAADETVSFGCDGVMYEIDLSESNAARLRAGLAEWISHARRIGGKGRAKTPTANRRPDAKAVREWARRNGHKVPERGRVPAVVVSAYQQTVG
ncbi:histone-like nucleoid-structuring protein Lsr2 [Nocardia carnea]|uniref:histone-like nucleoid-structuring protein Lsr2 n=1 Tax=Nocardia carnea TaxID=37328 RepID=UPI00245764FA|nr:Lsr2 family protein [Nocardia carnea]